MSSSKLFWEARDAICGNARWYTFSPCSDVSCLVWRNKDEDEGAGADAGVDAGDGAAAALLLEGGTDDLATSWSSVAVVGGGVGGPLAIFVWI